MTILMSKIVFYSGSHTCDACDEMLGRLLLLRSKFLLFCSGESFVFTMNMQQSMFGWTARYFWYYKYSFPAVLNEVNELNKNS